MPDQSFSFQQAAWKKLKQHKSAMAGLYIILLAIMVAIFAYWLAPDHSPNANRMMVEIGGKHPGYKQQFLAIKKTEMPDKTGVLQRTIAGETDIFQYIPINGFAQKGDSLIVDQYLDEGIFERKAFLLSGNQYHIETKYFWLGTDKYGRDIFSRLIIGTRVSLSVGLIAVIISVLIGILLGSLAGYFRGTTDDVIMWFINVVWSIPTLLLVFAITMALGKGFWQVFIAVGLTLWVSVARIIRGQVMGIRELEYIEATRALGFSHARTLFRHILPNVLGPVMVIAASNFASAIVMEAGLSFLGVGVQSPQPSWGLMIKENYNFIITHNPMLAIIPGLAIMVLVLAFNILGNGLRDAMDVRR
jgi:ABC-type dipeptide/oligopeptide/nickel transport system permease subunit